MAYFKSEPAILLNSHQIQLQLEEAIARFDELTESFTNEGSGWKIIGVEHLKLCSAIFDAVGGNSHIKTPSWVHMKKATLNIQNADDYCFLYCALAVSNYKSQHAERAAPYRRHMKDLNIEGLKFPLTVDQIPKFELTDQKESKPGHQR